MSRREAGATLRARLGMSRLTVSDALVVCDPYHRRMVGLDFIERGCEVVDTLADAGPLGGRRLVCVSDDAHVVHEAVRLLQGALGEGPDEVMLVQHAGLLDVIRDLEAGGHAERLAITSVAAREGTSFVTLGAARAGDASARDLVVGLVYGAEDAQASTVAQSAADTAQISDLQARLAEAAVLLAAATDQPPVELVSEDAKVLERRLVAETKRLAALQRKYDALAGSRLGRLTLKRWERKRRGARER